MSRRSRLGLLILLGSVLVIVASASIADGSGTETRLVVLVAEGWRSESRDVLSSSDDPFKLIEFAVGDVRAEQGLAREDVVFERFSYNYPERMYDGCATIRSLEDSAAALDHQLRDLMNQFPAAGFILVGHSLGGAVESYWAGAVADEAMLKRVTALFTLDSPVSGLEIANSVGFLEDLRTTFVCASLNKFVAELGTDPPSPAIERMHAASRKLGSSVFHWGSCLDLLVPCGCLFDIFNPCPGGSHGPDVNLENPGTFAGLSCVEASVLFGMLGGVVGSTLAGAQVLECAGANHSAILKDSAVIEEFMRVLRWALDQPPRRLETPFTTPVSGGGGIGTFNPVQADPTTPVPTVTPRPSTGGGSAGPSPTRTPTPPPIPSPTAQPPTLTPTPEPITVRVWTDEPSYFVGDNIRICYSISRGGTVILTDSPPSGSQITIVHGQKAAGTYCLVGTLEPPFGTDVLTLTLSEGSTLLASASTTYEILAPTVCESTAGFWDVSPSVANPLQSITISGDGTQFNGGWRQGEVVAFGLYDGHEHEFFLGTATVGCVDGEPYLQATFQIPASASPGEGGIWSEHRGIQTCCMPITILDDGSSGGGGGGSNGGSCDRAPSTPTNFNLIQGTTVLTWEVADPGGPGCVLQYRVASFGGQEIYVGSEPSVSLPTISCNSGYFVGAANQNFGFQYYNLWECPSP